MLIRTNKIQRSYRSNWFGYYFGNIYSFRNPTAAQYPLYSWQKFSSRVTSSTNKQSTRFLLGFSGGVRRYYITSVRVHIAYLALRSRHGHRFTRRASWISRRDMISSYRSHPMFLAIDRQIHSSLMYRAGNRASIQSRNNNSGEKRIARMRIIELARDNEWSAHSHWNIKIICHYFNKSVPPFSSAPFLGCLPSSTPSVSLSSFLLTPSPSSTRLLGLLSSARALEAGSRRCHCTPNERAIFHEYFYPVYWLPASQTVGWILIIRLLQLWFYFL